VAAEKGVQTALPIRNGGGKGNGSGGDPSVQLLAIKFNHDSGSATHDALNIRRNASAWVNVPEWQQGISVNPEDSPAAYAIAPTQGQTITVQASFSADPSIHSAEIRAVDNVVYPPGPGGCLGALFSLLQAIIRALFGNVLGEAKARSVTFTNGLSGFVSFDLIYVALSSSAVGTHTTEWRWQYRRHPNAKWTDIDITRHRIYVVLDIPSAPWQQSPYDPANIQLPWTETLDHSCSWASGATTVDGAAAQITRGVNNLGPAVITYDCPGGGSSHYSWASYGNTDNFLNGSFSCTAFLDRLKGGAGNGWYVNCSDCATIVSTFANILGCDLWASRMGYYFHLNDILGIGSNVWEPCCHGVDGWQDSFSYHEVAWEGGCAADDDVFDACLQVDGDADPTDHTSHTPLLPTDIRFGNPGDMQYRDRLAVPADRGNCSPRPTTRGRRAVS
jgi:hypothetical protein